MLRARSGEVPAYKIVSQARPLSIFGGKIFSRPHMKEKIVVWPARVYIQDASPRQ